jgi:hypothetical protein
LKSLAVIATKLLKLWSYKVIVIHALELRDLTSSIFSATDFCSKFMMVKLTHLFSQNNQYWSSDNPHLILSYLNGMESMCVQSSGEA